MAETLKLMVMAVLQGLTEFLPVSSSGHLVIAKGLLGLDAPGVRVEVMLHFGTLVAVVAFYWKRLWSIASGVLGLKRESLLQAAWLFVGCVPALVAYVVFGDAIEEHYDSSVKFTGAMLVCTGVVLTSLKFLRDPGHAKVGWWRAILIGIAQAIALLPGISRSGSTISCARFLGVKPEDAAEFSFLMSVPILAGATLLKIVHPEAGAEAVGWASLIPAMAVSGVVGYFAIKFLIKLLVGRGFWIFGLYCMAAGAAVLMFL